MSESSVEIALANRESVAAIAVAAIFLALPVLAIACPGAAWRAHARNRSAAAVVALFAAPAVYAMFLVALVVYA